METAEYKANNKHKQRADEIKAMGRYGNLRPLMAVHCRKDYWDAAYEHLAATGDTNGFDVFLKGA